jgi:hypothetical protein
MCAAVAAALAAALLSLGGASLVLADQSQGKGVDNGNVNGNGNAYGHANGQADQAPAAAAPQTAPAEPKHAKRQSQPQGPKHKSRAKAPRQKTKAPKQKQATAKAAPKRGSAHSKITICHSTGSSTNPYVQITINTNGLHGHAKHHDGRDIIPAPAGGCPGSEAPSGQQPGGGEPQQQSPAPAERPASTPQSETGQQAVLAAREQHTSAPAEKARTMVLGERIAGSSPAAATAPTAAQRAVRLGDKGGSLPFTGTDAILVLFLGSVLLLGGITLQRVLARR